MAPGPELRPVTLRGDTVFLEPLARSHAKDLLPSASEQELWKYMGMDAHKIGDLEYWVDQRLLDVAGGTAIAFTIRDAKTNQAVGSTSLFEYARPHRRIEIGHTWLGKSHRGTRANPEAKLVLMTHAFESLCLLRVQLKTDPENKRSRNAILRIGATEEGQLRNYVTYRDGSVHDRVFFSVIDREWPKVKERLQSLIASGRAPD